MEMAEIEQRNAAKRQLYEMFLGRVETDVVDMVLAGCNYKGIQQKAG